MSSLFNKSQIEQLENTQTNSINSLIELATNGYFPLFENEWIEDASKKNKKITGKERLRFKEIIIGLSKYQSITKKKNYITELNDLDRLSFIRNFLELVEFKVKRTRSEFQ